MKANFRLPLPFTFPREFFSSGLTEMYKRFCKLSRTLSQQVMEAAMTMTRRQFGIVTAGVTLAVSEGRAIAMTAISDDVRGKVTAVVKGWEAAWNAADMNAMWRLATDDVHWVNVVGMHWRGKADVQRAHQTFFDMMFKTRSAKLDEIETVEPLPGGAVVTVVRWSFGGFRQPDGVMRAPGKDRMSLVMVPRGDGFAIAHGANVHIDADAEKFDPIKH